MSARSEVRFADGGVGTAVGRGIGDLARSVRVRLQSAGVVTAQLDARLLVCAAAGMTHEQFIADPGHRVAQGALDVLEEFVARRVRREPVSRIIGAREFWGRQFVISPATLDPRPDSEALIETVLSDRDFLSIDAPRIADLGTGSGCLLVTLLCERTDAQGIAVDKDGEALAMARLNAEMHGVSERAMFVCGDWLDAIDGQFDLIVSNPPYVRSGDIADLEPEVALHEPSLALDGGADGLDCYRRIAHQARDRLTRHGILVLELGNGQLQAVSALLDQSGYSIGGTGNDLSGVARCLWATHSW